MSDERDDAPPSRVGQAVTPTHMVMFAFGPDGNFLLDAPEDERKGRELLALGMFELDRFYVNKRMRAAIEKAQQNAVLNGMMGESKKKIDKRILNG